MTFFIKQSVQFNVGWVCCILLKITKYPNKEIIAYDTILSSNPQAEVDGVKISNQYL